MRLATYDKVRKFMGFDSGVHTAVIEAALESATGSLAADVRCEGFGASSFVDLYYVTSMACLRFSQDQYRTRLALTAGFVSGAVVVTWGGSPDTVEDNTVSEGVLVNATKGSLIVTGIDLRNCYVQVSYAAGFAVDADYETNYAQADVPDWLSDAAMLRTVALLDASNPTLRHDDPQSAVRAVESLNQQTALLIAPHVRYFPSDLRPLA